jgi:hypothetical protein
MRDGSLDELQGRLGFVDFIDLYNKRRWPKGKTPSLSKKELMYRQFLIYRDFYIAKTPVILCEGKTDAVYLKHAIRSLVDDFPELAEKDDEGKVSLKVRLYKYTKWGIYLTQVATTDRGFPRRPPRSTSPSLCRALGPPPRPVERVGRRAFLGSSTAAC